jgi:hypothetical protein
MLVFLMWLLALLFQNGNGYSCEWTHGSEIGQLSGPISEASGLAISRRFPDRLYHINDSGDSGRFFITSLSGGNTRAVNVRGFSPFDAEDLAFGSCGDETDCLFIGDIGNNIMFRRPIEVAVIQEREKFPPVVDAKYRVQLRYPNGIPDAEAMALHPDGSLYILTKSQTPQLFRLRKDQWMEADGQPQTLELAATFDLQKLNAGAIGLERLPTAMDISPDGKRLLILTYHYAFEFYFDVSQALPPQASWKAGQQYRRIDIEVLSQQEAVAYTGDGVSFIYDTEKPWYSPAHLMRSDCRVARASLPVSPRRH